MEGHPALTQLARALFDVIAPPPDLTISQWADKFRKLSPEASAEPGDWDTSRAEYQRGIMDAISDPLIETVVIKSSAQVGKTEIVNNTVGYYIDQDPAPILVVQPTIEMGEAWSKDRLAPMIRDTPALQNKIKDPRSRDSGNTLLHKVFPGGQISIAGANSPASLASRPKRLVLGDEIDRFPLSAGSEGDPVNLAKKRTTTFWNRKHVFVSTPTIKGLSRIDTLFEQSDKRLFFVPCPDCDAYQVLRWEYVRWQKVDGAHKPDTALYFCKECGCGWDDVSRWRQIKKGYWQATAPFNRTAGFHLNEIYSPWQPLEVIVQNFLDCKDSPETMKTWVNTTLGETWEDNAGEKVDDDALFARREEYPAEVPMGAFVLTAGVDTQKDRLELEVKGWGHGEECWGICHKTLWGDPNESDVWDQLEDELNREFIHESGVKLRLSATCIDSGGHHTQMVYDFCRGREGRRIFAIIGRDGESRPIAGPYSQKQTGQNARKVKLFTLGVDAAKEVIYSRLLKDEPGPGCFHWPMAYPLEYFKQLASEKVVVKYDKGHAKRVWEKTRPRNEALDITVYAYAGLKMLDPNWEAWKERVIPSTPKDSTPAPQVRQRRVRSKGVL